MARELGLNPKQFGKLANHRQERWKRPLPEFVASLYVKRFGKAPDVVRTIEEVATAEMARRGASKMRKLAPTPSSQEPISPSRFAGAVEAVVKTNASPVEGLGLDQMQALPKARGRE